MDKKFLKKMFELRPTQNEKSDQLVQILQKFRVGILAGEVRSGKTLTALATADKLNKKHVLFITKKKAMSSIKSDYDLAGYDYKLTLINYESLHKAETNGVDLVICDESHSMGAFPKPSKRAKDVRAIVYGKNIDLILASGTPHPESLSQIFHQLSVSHHSPFAESNFYKWAKVYVDKYTIKLNGFDVTRYDRTNKELIEQKINPLKVTMTQSESGFTSKVREHFETVQMRPITYELTKQLKSDLVVEGKNETILADTSVKLQNKLHQLFSGTIKFESGNRAVIDPSKAEFIESKWKGQKIAIFYKFVAELDAIKSVYGDTITTNLEEFNSTSKSYAGQIVSSREGVNLSKADVLVFYNIDFSAVSYFQARDRLTTKERTENDVYWIFSANGIESAIYKAVSKKKDFTNRLFRTIINNSI
jgi:hypothetical protein